MNLLLDTHTLIWWLKGDPSLSEPAASAIADQENTVFLSAVVIWEIRIKQGLGKIVLPDDFNDAVSAQFMTELPITVSHADAVGVLPDIHRDPFDRMLVAQAWFEKLTVVTRDPMIPEYGVPVIVA